MRAATIRDGEIAVREHPDPEPGAGELLVTSMDRDGTRNGYDLDLTRAIADRTSVTVSIVATAS